MDQYFKKKQPPPQKKARDEFDEDEIFQAPVITREPTSRQAKLGSRVVLRVTASGKPLPSYQWFHNGKKISGANTDRLSLTKVRRMAIGAYHCEVKNFVGKAVSRAAMLSFFTATIPKLVIGPENSKLEEGKPFTLSVVSPKATVLKDFKIYWMFNGMRIKGAHGLVLNISAAKKKYEGEYKAMIATGSGLEMSNVAKLKVKLAKTEAIEADAPAEADPPPPKAAPIGWEEFTFNPENETASPDELEYIAPTAGPELNNNTNPDLPISQLGTQELIRELAAKDNISHLLADPGSEDPSSLITAAETGSPKEDAFDLSALISAPEQEDPSGLIEMLTNRESPAAPAQTSEPEDEGLIQDWGIQPGPQVTSAAVIPPPPKPQPKRPPPTLARKKAFLENMLLHWQSQARKRAA